ncbi:outer membrane protein assembly factor BamA [Marivirga atlantica]|jgi:outer membrane protein insertion porin family|uniref:Outer membrane protein assembly factor BamA n=1 Tax=Marivirga atlantica TaxID=1548457 RepID=A0A937DHB0_9BACT|nr:POTRA domain-containing protein [Marivirga atlantica]MBL0763805.1 outer membrane protein assembly factor BamA [Marivirga atlantica]
MKKLLGLFFVVIIGTVTSASAQSSSALNYNTPRKYEVAEIEARGLEYLDEGAVISITGIKVGDRVDIPGDDISFAIKKLWRQGLFSDVTVLYEVIEEGKIKLILDLLERPRLTKYTFEGVKKAKVTELSDEISLVKGRILTDASVKNAELNIIDFYKGKGFLNVKVDSRQKADTLIGNGVELIFKVDKGSKVKITDIYFVGNEAFGDRRLRSKMKETHEKLHFTLFEDIVSRAIHSSPKDWFKFFTKQDSVNHITLLDYLGEHVNVNFFKSSKLVRSEYKNDKNTVIDFYNSKGYRDAEITYDSIYTDKNGISIEIGINEGQKYYFRDIDWSGNFTYNDEILDRILSIEKGDVYDLEKIQRKLNYDPVGGDITSLYMDNGYLFFNVTPVEVKVDSDSIDVEMRIYEGSKATISEVNISGNTRTNDHVIIRELQTIPGEYFSRRDLIETTRRLSQLGYFNPETVNPVPVPNAADGTVDINWELEEVSNDQVQLSGGWGGQIGFVGSLGITFNNFSLGNFLDFGNWDPLPVGDGQVLSLQFQANGRQYQSYNASFTEPWLGGKKPNALTVGGSYSFIGQIDYRDLSAPARGSFRISRGYVTLSRRLQWPDQFFTLANTLEYSRYNLNNYGRSLGCATCEANNVIFKTTIARNSVDNPIFPRSGSNISLAISLTPPYSTFNNLNYNEVSFERSIKWVEYNKWMFDASFFNKIIGDLVINTRANFGIINNYKSGVSVGPFERFILGGSGLGGQNFLLGSDIIGLRGYEDNSLSPVEYVSSGESPEPTRLSGGTIYNKFVMELRYPISLNPSATIYVLGFGEAGNNWANFNEYNPYNLKRSAGVGARIFMPAFGTIGIDWGYGFDKLDGSNVISGGQIHFTIGNQIR